MRSSASANVARIARLRAAVSATLNIACMPFEEGDVVAACVVLRHGMRFELADLVYSVSERVGAPVDIEAAVSTSAVKLTFSVRPPGGIYHFLSREMSVFIALAVSVAAWIMATLVATQDYAACGRLPLLDTPNGICLLVALVMYALPGKCPRAPAGD